MNWNYLGYALLALYLIWLIRQYVGVSVKVTWGKSDSCEGDARGKD